MPNRLKRALTVAGAATAVVAIAMTSAAAATPTFTVTAGSAATGTSVAFTGTTSGTTPQVTFVDTTSNTTLTCDSSKVPGTIKTGTKLKGAGIASITGSKSTFTNCKGPFGLVFTVAGSGTWKLNATSGTTTAATGNISAVKASVKDGSVCNFTVTGTVAGTYHDSNTSLALPGTTSGLTIAGVPSGQCFGVINNGDKASFKGTYVVKATTTAYNPVKVTSP